MPAYDASAGALSPGTALLAHVIRSAIEAGTPRLHFLIGAQRYKLRWQPAPLALRAVRWYAPALRGAALRLYDAFRATERPGAVPSATDDDG